jgi:hypothetical protein
MPQKEPQTVRYLIEGKGRPKIGKKKWWLHKSKWTKKADSSNQLLFGTHDNSINQNKDKKLSAPLEIQVEEFPRLRGPWISDKPMDLPYGLPLYLKSSAAGPGNTHGNMAGIDRSALIWSCLTRNQKRACGGGSEVETTTARRPATATVAVDTSPGGQAGSGDRGSRSPVSAPLRGY